MIARSSGSIRAESAVELTRSEKHHEELSMLGAGGADAAVATAGFGAFFSRASEFSYRAQQLPSMTERHPDLFKALIRKVAQDCKAYLWCDNHGALTIRPADGRGLGEQATLDGRQGSYARRAAATKDRNRLHIRLRRPVGASAHG